MQYYQSHDRKICNIQLKLYIFKNKIGCIPCKWNLADSYAIHRMPTKKGSLFFRCISRNTLDTGNSLTHSLTPSQSANHPLGQGSRSFRQSKDVKTGNRAIIAITAIMVITDSKAIAAIMVITAITDIRAITASTGIRANCSQYNYYCEKMSLQ